MTRRIQFRVWDINNKGVFEMSKPFNPFFYGGVFTSNAIFMENTLLEDETDKEIYEGDIMSSLGDDICVVRKIKDTASFMLETINPKDKRDSLLIPLYRGNEYRKVIGNIYENQELLWK
ncbi:MAG: YopX family protein [Metamycoplasmataceae bacterium]